MEISEKKSVLKDFIQEGLVYANLDEYLVRELKRAGYHGVSIVKTPLGTRVHITAERPALVIGRHGQTIKYLTTIFKDDFSLENPQIEVIQLDEPSLSARVVASKIANAIFRGVRYRSAANVAFRRIMASGAVGAEIIISGKLISKRSRIVKFREGKMIKSGYPKEVFVDEGKDQCLLKPGIVGVKVKILQPSFIGADSILIREDEAKKMMDQFVQEEAKREEPEGKEEV